MKVTKVTYNPVDKSKDQKANILGMISVVLDKELVINNIRLIAGKFGPFLGYPSYKNSDGEWANAVFPLTKELRQSILDTVLEESGLKDNEDKTYEEKSTEDVEDFF